MCFCRLSVTLHELYLSSRPRVYSCSCAFGAWAYRVTLQDCCNLIMEEGESHGLARSREKKMKTEFVKRSLECGVHGGM